MGRKKRKAAEVEEPETAEAQTDATEKVPVEPASAPTASEKKLASKYGLTAHSGEIVTEDIYVSDGSEDENEDVDVVLSGSKIGLMRRGLAHPSVLIQPNRQWTRASAAEDEAAAAAVDESEKERQREEELSKLDPAERAARLMIEKQRKEEEEKEAARKKESEENAGRDPTLFSKRTAFDIRFDQIEDKPWTRGGDISEFFNYGFVEEDWQVYAEHQLQIRQELIDAARQKRAPDPTIVPVIPKATTLKAANSSTLEAVQVKEDAQVSSEPAGPALAPDKEGDEKLEPTAPKKEVKDIEVGAGGAWSAGARPGSYLARLIEEQSSTEKEARDGRRVVHAEDREHRNQSGDGDDRDPYQHSQDGAGRCEDQRQNEYEGYSGGSRNPSDQYGAGGRGWQERSFRGGRGFAGRGRGGNWQGRGDARNWQREDPRWRR